MNRIANTTRVDRLFEILVEHEGKFNRSFSFIPSENILSPLARLAFLSDGFSRYFFDEKEVSGRWSFEGGSIIGRIQQEILVPLFRRVGRAEHVNLHPVSGLTGMTLALAAFGGGPASRVISVPVANGGHPDTRYVSEKLGYRVLEMPFADWAHVDLDALGRMVRKKRPSLVYFDHATALFPLDIKVVIHTIRKAARAPIHIHVDTSHVNGLVWGGQLPNPLDCGADSYGGSTHKTFPGPHKAVLFANDRQVADRLALTSSNMISHHHIASVVALAITLIEFVECRGETYAARICRNAKAFARALDDRGFQVQGKAWGFTDNHQVWIAVPAGLDTFRAASLLFQAGLVVNPYSPLPSLGGPGLRLGVNEPTRLGLGAGDFETLADRFADLLLAERPVGEVAHAVAELRRRHRPEFCFQDHVFEAKLVELSAAFEDCRRLIRPATRGQAQAD